MGGGDGNKWWFRDRQLLEEAMRKADYPDPLVVLRLPAAPRNPLIHVAKREPPRHCCASEPTKSHQDDG